MTHANRAALREAMGLALELATAEAARVHQALAGHAPQRHAEADRAVLVIRAALTLVSEDGAGPPDADAVNHELFEIVPPRTNCVVIGGASDKNQVYVSMDARPNKGLWTLGSRAYLCEAMPAEESERLDWMLANPLMRVYGNDETGWTVWDCSLGLVEVGAGPTARAAVDQARAVAATGPATRAVTSTGRD